jgi:hypothetical protein
MFLEDVHGHFPDIQNFTYDDKPVPFEHDNNHFRLEPWRIRAFIGKVIDCHKPMHDVEVASGMYDNLQQRFTKIDNKLELIHENIEILKEKADAVLRQTLQLSEYTVPRLFIVLPEDTSRYNPAHWFQLNYRLYFLCECENDIERHFAFHEGYEIKEPREFFRKYATHLRKMLTVVKYAMRAGSFILPQLKHIDSKISNSTIHQGQKLLYDFSNSTEQLGNILTAVEQSENISTERTFQHIEGVELREIQSFLKKVDAHHTLGNLFRSVTKDGNVRWVCIQHYEQCYSERAIKGLHEEFKNLGGEITRDTAVISEQASNNCSEILSVLCKGLRVCSIILKNLNIKHKNFDELLNFAQQSAIHSLQLENITVLSHPFNIKKRVIISKLSKTVQANDKLNIQYSFTKSLSEFASETIHAMIEINPRLIFRVRSREETPSLELVGTNKTGFTLSINNSDEKYDINYQTAIRNIFLIIPNITKVLLHNGVISESISTCFYQFLTTSQTLQELTIDCRLTIEQTKKLSASLSDNRTLKTLHMFNIWELNDEFDGFEEIFQILQKNALIVEFIWTCHTDLLQLDSIAKCLLQNKSLRILRLPKCEIHQNTDIELCESFLQNTSIHTLSLELISTNCEASLERLARAMDKNETIETLELKCSDSSAIFYRENHIPDSENSSVSLSPAKTSINPFLTCPDGEHRHVSHEEVIPPPLVPTPEDNSKHISIVSFYTLCNHAPFYKQIQEVTKNFKLKELQVTVGGHVEMRDVTLSIKSNLTVTELRITKRMLTVKDIQMLIEALHNNTTITHLSLNDINISINYFCEIFHVLRDDRTLRVLEVSNCVSHSDRDLFAQQIKTLELNNPSLKILYENQ